MSSIPLSPAKMSLIYVRLRATRLKNFIASGWGRKKKVTQGRSAIAGKAKAGIFSILIFLYLAGVLGASSVNATHMQLEKYGFLFTTIYATTFGTQWIVFTLMNMVTRELSRTESDVEWLGTLPAPWTILFTSKAIERGFLSIFMGFLTVSLAACAYFSGHSPFVVLPLALAFVIPLQIVAGVWQVTAEYFLRLKLSAAKLRNAQATIAFVTMVPMMMTISPQLLNGANLWQKLALNLPRFAFDFAPALAARIVMENGAATAANIGLFILQIAIGLGLGIWSLQKVLAAGAVGSSPQDTTRGQPKSAAKKESRVFGWFSPIIRRELSLLARDRNFLTQTVLLPILLLGVQLVVGVSEAGRHSSESGLPSSMPVFLLFFSLAFLLAAACFQIVNSEGQALWILVSSPVSLEAVFREKFRMWQAFALAVSLVGIATFYGMGLIPLETKSIVQFLLIVVGVVIYTYIATSIGIFSANPLSDDVQKRVKVSAFYFYMGLVTLYFPGLLVYSYWTTFVGTFLMALFAYAIWQEARAYIPYMLDPIVAPKSKVSLMHGILAAILFFLLQIVITFLALNLTKNPGAELLAAFAGAGIISFLIMRLYFWKKKTENLPRFIGKNWPSNIATGIALGAVCFAVAWIYQKQMLSHHWFGVDPENFLKPSFNQMYVFLGLLAVVAAPFAEEFMFRGLIFQGLKRNFSVGVSMFGSALIFGCMHPSASFVPVATMGLISAVAYEKTKNLTASIALHAVYNACVIFVPLLVPHLYS